MLHVLRLFPYVTMNIAIEVKYAGQFVQNSMLIFTITSRSNHLEIYVAFLLMYCYNYFC